MTSVSWARGWPSVVRCTMADFMPGKCEKCQIPEIDLSHSRIVEHKHITRAEMFESGKDITITVETDGILFNGFIGRKVRCFVCEVQTTYSFIVMDVKFELHGPLNFERAVLQVIEDYDIQNELWTRLRNYRHYSMFLRETIGYRGYATQELAVAALSDAAIRYTRVRR